MTPPQILPPGFQSLEPFVDRWAQPTTAGRAAARSASGEAERSAFYEAAKDLLPEAIAYLDARPLGQLAEDEERLMNLVLALAHVVLAVEVQGSAEATHRPARDKMRITRTAADRPAQA